MEPNASFWCDRRVAVTGGTGFLGWHLIRRLVHLGARVRAFALPPPPGHPILAQSAIELVLGDLRDAAAVGRALADADTVFHAGGVVAAWGPGLAAMDSVHCQGTVNVLAAAPHARMIHVSSIVTIGGTPSGAILDEDSPFPRPEPRVNYVRAKRAAEKLAFAAAAAGQDVVITNPGYLVGPDDSGRSAMGRLCKRAWRGRVPIAPPGGFNLVDVRDVAAGNLLAAEHGRPGRRYILGGENHSLADFLRLLAAAAGWSPRAVPTVPPYILTAIAELAELRARVTGREPYPSREGSRMNHYYWFVRSDRAVRELGYATRQLAATLRDAYAWYASRGLGAPRGINRWWLRPSGRSSRPEQITDVA